MVKPAVFHKILARSTLEIGSLFTWLKPKRLFWRAGFYPANQSNLKSFQKALIGRKKAGPSKKPLLFSSRKQANSVTNKASRKQRKTIWIGYVVNTEQNFFSNYHRKTLD